MDCRDVWFCSSCGSLVLCVPSDSVFPCSCVGILTGLLLSLFMIHPCRPFPFSFLLFELRIWLIGSRTMFECGFSLIWIGCDGRLEDSRVRMCFVRSVGGIGACGWQRLILFYFRNGWWWLPFQWRCGKLASHFLINSFHAYCFGCLQCWWLKTWSHLFMARPSEL